MNPRIDAIGHTATQHTGHSGPATKSSTAFSRILEQTLTGIDRGIAVPGTTEPLDARGALELQAAVYRHAERLEITSRLLDHGVGAVKTVLQTRV